MVNSIVAVKPLLSSKVTIDRSYDPKVIEKYLTDESKIFIGIAEAIVFPTDEPQIARVLTEANGKKTRVTVSGAGTGITGSRVPIGGIVLSTEHLRSVSGELKKGEKLLESKDGYSIRIGKDEPSETFYAIASPGIPLDIFKKMIETEHLCYPPDPTELTAFLGGTVATNASGARTFFYGSTRDYIRRLRIVMVNGEVLNIKRGRIFAKKNRFIIITSDGKKIDLLLPSYSMPSVRKNAAGYYIKPSMDLIDLFIGSEGTLGVISEIEVKLVKKPPKILAVFAYFASEKDTLAFLKKLKDPVTSNKLTILSIEFFDKNSIEFLREHSTFKMPPNVNEILFFELVVSTDEELEKILDITIALLENYNVVDTDASVWTDWLTKAKNVRHTLPEEVNQFVRSHGTYKVATDISVPDLALETMLNFFNSKGKEAKIPYVIFGHIGDSHLHFNFLPTTKFQLKEAVKTCTIFWQQAVALGGTISAEHGVGKKQYMENSHRKMLLNLMYGPDGLKEIKRLKETIDPNNILNIGNIYE